MAATSDEEIESLLSSFDQIYDDFKIGIAQIQSLQSNCNAGIKRREVLEFTANSLRLDNERLTRLYTGSLNKLADQFVCHSKYQSLKKELESVRDRHLTEVNEHQNVLESLKQDHAAKITELETQMRSILIEKAVNEATINQLHQDLAAQKTHVEILMSRLEQIHFDVASRYQHEIQDLKDCLLIEQEEKNELNKKLQILEKELLISRTKLLEHHREITSNQQVETLKQKIMKLRKENEVLKRTLLDIRDN